jgi:hypothetical protein
MRSRFWISYLMRFGIKLLTWIREYSSWNHPLPRSCQCLKKHIRSKGFTTKAPQVYSSGGMENHYYMDQEIEIKINLTSEQFLILETFCCVHPNDRKATTMKLKMLETRTQLEIVRYLQCTQWSFNLEDEILLRGEFCNIPDFPGMLMNAKMWISKKNEFECLPKL